MTYDDWLLGRKVSSDHSYVEYVECTKPFAGLQVGSYHLIEDNHARFESKIDNMILTFVAVNEHFSNSTRIPRSGRFVANDVHDLHNNWDYDYEIKDNKVHIADGWVVYNFNQFVRAKKRLL